MKKILILFVLVLSLGLASCGFSDKYAPDENVSLEEMRSNGNKTYLGFVGTFCPYCQQELPILDAFYREHKGEVNMQLYVTDRKRFLGDYKIPQDISSSQYTYEQITGESCGSVPTYVILDQYGEIQEKVCGGSLTKTQLEAKLLLSDAEREDMNLLPDDTTNTMDTTYQLTPLQEGDIAATLHTNMGDITLKFFPDDAPLTTNNFLTHAKNGYYDGLIFHRVIQDFMIQGGDPLGTGIGGESIYGESFKDEFSPKLYNIAGSISMANSGPNTNGSQFFINQVDNNFLDGKHSVFGQVVEGMDIVESIISVETDSQNKPLEDVVIESISVQQFNGEALEAFDYDADKILQEILETQLSRVAKDGDPVFVHYLLTDSDNGEEYDSSYTRGQPIPFTIGGGDLLPGFESAVIGMKVGDKKEVILEAKDAYGEWDEANVQTVEKSSLQAYVDEGFTLEKGTKLPTEAGYEVEILDADDENITVDLNFPLMGKNLKFEIELVGFAN